MKNMLVCLILFAVLAVIPAPALAAGGIADEAATMAMREATADSRVLQLRSFLSSFNSPMTGEAEHFVSEADRLGLDWRLVAAIAGVESTFGKHVPAGSFNGWGWGIPTGAQSGIAFSDWKAGITTVSEGLRKNYVDRGAVTVEQIGRIYAASPRWAGNVRFFLAKIDAFAAEDIRLLAVTI
jgi:hypothetical protein